MTDGRSGLSSTTSTNMEVYVKSTGKVIDKNIAWLTIKLDGDDQILHLPRHNYSELNLSVGDKVKILEPDSPIGGNMNTILERIDEEGL